MRQLHRAAEVEDIAEHIFAKQKQAKYQSQMVHVLW